jgi:hypothetical protein
MPKKKGRPPRMVQTHPMQIRVSPEFLEKLDNWRRMQPDLPTRTESIRRIVEGVIADVGGQKTRRKRT